MKKILKLFVVLFLCVGTIGCENKDSSVNKSSKSSKDSATSVDKNVDETIQIGDTITTDKYELTLKAVELSYDVEPEIPNSFYTHYEADEGKVYVYVKIDVKNLDKADLQCEDIYSISVDYNNGYTYSGFNIVREADTNFTYANITSITPLETLGVDSLVECPEEVEKSQDKPLIITVKLNNGDKYTYKMR